jgi:hypothetical protein
MNMKKGRLFPAQENLAVDQDHHHSEKVVPIVHTISIFKVDQLS